MLFSLHYAFDSMPPTGKGMVSPRGHACSCVYPEPFIIILFFCPFYVLYLTNLLYIAMCVGYLGSHLFHSYVFPLHGLTPETSEFLWVL